MIVINPSGRTRTDPDGPGRTRTDRTDPDGPGRTDGWTDAWTGQTGPIGICIKFKTGGVTLDLHQTHSPNNCSGLWTTARARPTLTSLQTGDASPLGVNSGSGDRGHTQLRSRAAQGR